MTGGVPFPWSPHLIRNWSFRPSTNEQYAVGPKRREWTNSGTSEETMGVVLHLLHGMGCIKYNCHRSLKNERLKKGPEPNLWTPPAKLGQNLTSQHLYIYIYCRVIIWSKFGVLESYYLVQVRVIIWSKWGFLANFYSGFKRFLHTQLSFCVFCLCPILSGNFLKIAFFKKRVQKLGFSIFNVLSLNFENSFF